MIYRILDIPWVYRLTQLILAPGKAEVVAARIRDALPRAAQASEVLDIGCGPTSSFATVGVFPIGLDISTSYAQAYTRAGGVAAVGRADCFPFAPASFLAVCSVGLFHHMPDQEVHTCLREMLSCTKIGGQVIILDGVLPRFKWRRPLAYLIRRGDRGGFMRSEEALRALLPAEKTWNIVRFNTAKTGLEAVLCTTTL